MLGGREAEIRGSQVVLDCVPDEIEKQLEYLKYDVSLVNGEYGRYLLKVMAITEMETNKTKAEIDKIEGIKSRLKVLIKFVSKSAPAGVPHIETNAKVQATTEIGMATSLELWSCEIYKTETKGKTMKLETQKTSGIKVQVKALAFVAFAWLAFAVGAGLT